MGVGEDVAIVVDDEPGAGGRAATAASATAEGVEERRALGLQRGLDEDDSRRVLLVDLVHRQALAAALLSGRLREGRRLERRGPGGGGGGGGPPRRGGG